MEFEICKHKSVPRRFIVDTKEEGELVDGWMDGRLPEKSEGYCYSDSYSNAIRLWVIRVFGE